MPLAILGISWSSLGALITGVGALLILGDLVTAGGLTWGGTLPAPGARASAAVAAAGSLLIAAGSVVLVFAAAHIDVIAVVVVLVCAALLTYGGMTIKLQAHMRLIEADDDTMPRRSFVWCLRHPLWRPT